MLNSLGPILFILVFFALLGSAIWVIFQRPALPTWASAAWRPPSRWLSQDPTSRQAQKYAVIAAAAGLLLLLAPGPEIIAFAGVQLLAIALLLVLLDLLQQHRRTQDQRSTVLAALASSNAERAADALAIALAEGWMTDGALIGLSLQNANWSAATISHVHLDRVNLTKANLQGIVAIRASLQAVTLDSANLDRAVLDGSQMQHASLCAARMRHASLRTSDLSHADLRGARLQNSDFTGALLCHAQLASANLKGASLLSADLTDATYDQYTKWPKSFRPEAAGAYLLAEPDVPKLEEQSDGALR